MTDFVIPIVPGGRGVDDGRPVVTVDLDGVLCEPPLGWNFTAHGPVMPVEHPPSKGRLKRLMWPSESVRYMGRRAMPGARQFVEDLSIRYRVLIVTARGAPALPWTRRWLTRAGIWPFIDGLVFRMDPRQPSYVFKALAAGAIEPAWHVEDDGRTAVYVHAQAHRPVALIAWRRNAGEYTRGVVRVTDLAAAARLILASDQSSSPSSSMS